MRVINISLDTKALDKNSAVFKRMLEYADLVDSLDIICYSPNKKYSVVSENNLTIYPTNSLSKVTFIKDAYFLAKGIIQKKNLAPKETVITTQDPFETGLVGYLIKKKFQVGLNIQDHGGFFEAEYFFRRESILNLFRLPLGKFIIKKADSIRTVSMREKEYLIKNFQISPEKIFNFPIYTNWELIAKQPIHIDIKKKYPGFKNYIVTICRLEKVKNLPLLIESFELVLQEHPESLFLIVGKGTEEKKLKKLISIKKLNKNIIVEPWTDDPISYYKTADLLVISSNSEGWGLTAIEASASRCPVIMTDTGCAGEFIKDRKNGWIVPVNDKIKLTAVIKEALTSPEERKSIAQIAYQDLIQLPTQEKTLELLKSSWITALPSLPKIKLCYLLPHFDLNTDSHYYHLYNFINQSAKGLDIHLIVEKNYSDISYFTNVKSIAVQKLNFLPLRVLENLILIIKARFQGYKNFYIHYSYISAINSSLVSRLSGAITWYWSCGMMWLFKKDRFNQFLIKITLHLVNYLVTGAQALAKGYSKNYNIPEAKIKIMPNWIEAERFNQKFHRPEIIKKFSLPEANHYVLFAHRLAERKGAQYITRIVKSFSSDCVFLIAGDGPYRTTLEKEIANDHLKNIVLLGKIKNSLIPELMNLASVFLMPSEEEGFPRVLIEAMASGLPYIASDIGGVREISPLCEQKYICPVGDIPAFSQGIKEILNQGKNNFQSDLKERAYTYSEKNVLKIFNQLFSNKNEKYLSPDNSSLS